MSTSFVVDIDTKPQLVIGYKHQNSFVENRPFRYEQMADFMLDLGRDDHLTSWNVADAFHDVLPATREIAPLAFRVGSTIYFPLPMPFGLKLAPWIWTKLMRPVVAYLRARGFKLMPYMGDFGCLAATPHRASPVTRAQATAGRSEAIAVFRRLGIEIHKTKGAAIGTQTLPLMGFPIDTSRCLLLLKPDRLRSVVGSAVSLRRHATTHRRWVTLRALQRFCGAAVSTSPAVPDARFYLQALYACFPTGPRRGMRQLSARALKDLEWWCGLATCPDVGRALWQQPVQGELTTDACGYGCGGLLGRLVPARGFFSPDDRAAHINVQEMRAML